MTILDLTEKIEDGCAIASLTLASTLRALLRRLEENAVVRQARRLLAAHPDESALLLNRARKLFACPAPTGYAHPGDLALTAYLYILAQFPSPNVESFVKQVLAAERPEFFSATAMARYFVDRISATTLVTARDLPPGFSPAAMAPPPGVIRSLALQNHQTVPRDTTLARVPDTGRAGSPRLAA